MRAGSTGSTIRNNLADYTGADDNPRGVLTVTGTDPTDLTIEFNHFQGWNGAIFLQGTIGPVVERTGGHGIRGTFSGVD